MKRYGDDRIVDQDDDRCAFRLGMDLMQKAAGRNRCSIINEHFRHDSVFGHRMSIAKNCRSNDVMDLLIWR